MNWKSEYFTPDLFGRETSSLGRKEPVKIRSKNEIAELVQTLGSLQKEVSAKIGAINQRLSNMAQKGMCFCNWKMSLVAEGEAELFKFLECHCLFMSQDKTHF